MSDPTPKARTPIIEWLHALPHAERDQLARRYARAAELAGAVVRKPDGHGGDSIVPIPPLLTPEPIPRAQRSLMESDAHALLEALSLLTRWLMTPRGARDRERLFASFSPFEAEALPVFRAAEHLATARVDFLVDVDGRHRALEVNATIPAMQGYSDVIAETFLREVGAARGLAPGQIDTLCDGNGRNTDDLLAALYAHYRRLGGTSTTPSIAIVHREGDAQLGELQHYAHRFAQLGSETVLATPAEASLDGAGNLRVAGRRFDLIYRHVFARRLDPGAAFARACLDPNRHRILNPVASHLEVKGMLAWLSEAGSPGTGDALAADLALAESHRDAIRRALPWTRVLSHGPAIAPDGETVPDLAEHVAAAGDRFVVKRSWDYGGRSVFLGPELGESDHDDTTAARAAEACAVAIGREEPGRLSWPELVRAAARDRRDLWVAQEKVRFTPRRHLLAGPAGAAERSFYIDCSLYTTLGTETRPHGGASRAAPGKIVNILGGGGLAPLILDEILALL